MALKRPPTPEEADGNRVTWKDLVNSLVAVKVHDYLRREDGSKDPGTFTKPDGTPQVSYRMVGDVVVFKGEHAGETFENMWVTGAGVLRQLEPTLGTGDYTAAWLRKDENRYVLLEPTGAEYDMIEQKLSAPADSGTPPF